MKGNYIYKIALLALLVIGLAGIVIFAIKTVSAPQKAEKSDCVSDLLDSNKLVYIADRSSQSVDALKPAYYDMLDFSELLSKNGADASKLDEMRHSYIVSMIPDVASRYSKMLLDFCTAEKINIVITFCDELKKTGMLSKRAPLLTTDDCSPLDRFYKCRKDYNDANSHLRSYPRTMQSVCNLIDECKADLNKTYISNSDLRSKLENKPSAVATTLLNKEISDMNYEMRNTWTDMEREMYVAKYSKWKKKTEEYLKVASKYSVINSGLSRLRTELDANLRNATNYYVKKEEEEKKNRHWWR